jgi:hypothetical protein
VQEFVKGFGRENRIVNRTRRQSLGTDVEIALARCETVQQTHHGKNLEVKREALEVKVVTFFNF